MGENMSWSSSTEKQTVSSEENKPARLAGRTAPYTNVQLHNAYGFIS